MTETMKEICCKDCGQKISDCDKFCPNCGSKKRLTKLKLEGELELHKQVKGKEKENNTKEPVKEFTVGDDLHRKSGKWHNKERYIDRKNDSYIEIIKDKNTGKIIHKCEEPLSKHKGHGSDKHKKKSKTNDLAQ